MVECIKDDLYHKGCVDSQVAQLPSSCPMFPMASLHRDTSLCSCDRLSCEAMGYPEIQAAATGIQRPCWYLDQGGWECPPVPPPSCVSSNACNLHSADLCAPHCWVWEKSQPFQGIPVLNTSLDFCFLPKGKRHMFGKGKQLLASNPFEYNGFFSIPQDNLILPFQSGSKANFPGI